MEQGIAKIIASMAELDDFFAKKDKKKGKSKTKFVTADELVKNLEEVKKLEVAATAAIKLKKPDVLTAATATAAGGVAEGGGEKEITVETVPEVSVKTSDNAFHVLVKSLNTFTYVDSLLKRNGRNSSRSSARITVGSRLAS